MPNAVLCAWLALLFAATNALRDYYVADSVGVRIQQIAYKIGNN